MVKDRIEIRLNERCLTSEALVFYVMNKLSSLGRSCSVSVMGAMPVISVDGTLYRVTVQSPAGDIFGLQSAVLTRIPSA